MNCPTFLKTSVASALISSMLATAGLAAPEELTVALGGDIPTLDPSQDTSPIGLNYRLNVFDALTQLARDGSVEPRLAESWEYNEDLTEWTFHLRPNVKFHDGSELTASDVVFTIEHIKADPTSPVQAFIKLVDKVEALDDQTVKFTLTQPYSMFDRQAKYAFVMSEDYYDEVGDEGYATEPVGTGPYRLAEWRKDDRMVLEAFEDYWGGEPAVKRGILRPMPSAAGRANALISGEVDLVPDLPPSLMSMLESRDGIVVEIDQGYRVSFLSMAPDQEPFDDPKIRHAIDVAIDREAIAEQLLRGTGRATGMMIPPTNEGYDSSFEAVEYDPELAKKLLEEAGYDGTLITMDYPNNNWPMANEAAQAISGYLTEAGLNIELSPMEFNAFFPLWLQDDLSSMYYFAFGSSQYHAEGILATMYEEGGHFSGINPEISDLVGQQRKETDPEKKQELISEAFRLSNEERHYVPLYDMLHVYGIKSGIEYEPYPDGVVRFYSFD